MPYELQLFEIEGKGRGVRVKEKVPKGAYVREYEGEVYPRKERAAREREYAANGEGCYILDCQTREGWICVDATRSYSAIGRLLNHAPRFLPTLVPYKPLLVNGQWRVGFVASKDLMPGCELLWDYGCEPGGEEWLMRRRRATDISAKESALEFRMLCKGVLTVKKYVDVLQLILKHGSCTWVGMTRRNNGKKMTKRKRGVRENLVEMRTRKREVRKNVVMIDK